LIKKYDFFRRKASAVVEVTFRHRVVLAFENFLEVRTVSALWHEANLPATKGEFPLDFGKGFYIRAQARNFLV
jgi:hypothetical protein